MSESCMCEIDISGQIDNSWNKKSVMAIVGKKIRDAISVDAKFKNMIKKRFDGKLKTRDIAQWIHAFLIFNCLNRNQRFIEKIEICRDCGPSRTVHNYIQKIGSHLGYPNLAQDVKFNFNGVAGNSPAHKLARKSFKHDKYIKYELTPSDVNKLMEIIDRNTSKK